MLTMHTADAPPPLALAVDIGGTKVAVAAIDATGHARTLIARHPVPFDAAGVADAEALVELLAPHVAELEGLGAEVAGIGLSVCGNIDRATGHAVLVPNLHWRDVPFASLVARRFGLPVYAATDVRLAAQAEALWGAARGVPHFAWVTIGTGFGSYLFLDGKIYGGAHGYAGNFGHYTVDEVNGYPCGCGRRGCLETYVAGPAIARRGQEALDAGHSPALRALAPDGRVTTSLVFKAEAQGDPSAAAIVEDVIRRLSITLGGLVTLLDLPLLILGGGVVHGSPTLVERISHGIRPYLMTAESLRDLRITQESLPNSALYGAATEVFLCSGLLHL
jgi:glucokinase